MYNYDHIENSMVYSTVFFIEMCRDRGKNGGGNSKVSGKEGCEHSKEMVVLY